MRDVVMTVVIPAYNESGNIKRITERIYKLLKSEFSFEILFIDDGSSDSTWGEMVEMSCQFDCVRAIKLSRNFGKEAAIFAGLSNVRGECAVVIDSDLQHPPEKIPEMYRMWCEGYKIVECVKASRGKENGLRAVAVNLFYKMMSRMMKLDMSNCSDFKLLDRKVIDALLSMPEKNVFFRALSAWVGFKTYKIEFDVQERAGGTSKWSLKSLIKYAINNIALFSGGPLQIITVLGVVCFILAIIFGVFSIGQAVGTTDAQYVIILVVQCLLAGIIMMGMGLMGYYIQKVFDEVKGRPKFFVEEECDEVKCDNKEVCR